MKRKWLEQIGLTAEALEKAGLDKSIIDKIMEENGSDIETAKRTAETKVPELESTVQSLKDQLKAANDQIGKFKDMKTPEEVEESISSWKQKVEQAEKTHKEAVLQLKRDHAIEAMLKDTYKAKNVRAVVALLNQESIKFDEKTGKITGLEEQVIGTKNEEGVVVSKGLKDSDSFLFDDAKQPPRFVDSTSHKGDGQPPDTFASAISERLATQQAKK